MAATQIAEVNHWRGRCLDDFARAEQSIIRFIERWQEAAADTAPTLAETASARSRNLIGALQKHRADSPDARALVKLLTLWKYREKDRNELVHGRFTVKSNEDGWIVINRLITVKKQVGTVQEELRTQGEAEAFRLAVTNERKALETALNDFSEFVSA